MINNATVQDILRGSRSPNQLSTGIIYNALGWKLLFYRYDNGIFSARNHTEINITPAKMKL